MNAFLRHLDRQRYEEEANCDVEIIPAAFIEAAERHIARYNRPLLKTFLRPEQTFYVTKGTLSVREVVRSDKIVST